jgi:hypothetical protein
MKLSPQVWSQSQYFLLESDLESIGKWPLNASSTNIPYFLNSTLSLLFQTTCNQFPISLFSYPFHSLTPDYSVGSCLRHSFLVQYDMSVVSCCLPPPSTLQSITSFHWCFYDNRLFTCINNGVIGWHIKTHCHVITIASKCNCNFICTHHPFTD